MCAEASVHVCASVQAHWWETLSEALRDRAQPLGRDNLHSNLLEKNWKTIHLCPSLYAGKSELTESFYSETAGERK
jgi:hypothetical protein